MSIEFYIASTHKIQLLVIILYGSPVLSLTNFRTILKKKNKKCFKSHFLPRKYKFTGRTKSACYWWQKPGNLLRVIFELFTRGCTNSIELNGSIFSSNRNGVCWQLNLRNNKTRQSRVWFCREIRIPFP